MESPTDQRITETSSALIMENILAEMQKIHEVFLQKVIRNEQKTEALGIMTRVIDQIKAMSNEIKETPAQQERQQPLENINHEQVSLKQVMTELADIKKTIKQTYSQAAQRAMTPPITIGHETHHGCTSNHNHEHEGTQQEHETSKEQEKDMARIEQAKKDVILTTREANEDTKEKMEKMEEETIKDSLQLVIQKNESTAAVEIKDVRKLAKQVVRIRCQNERDATKLRQLNWKEILGGVTVMRTEYGIVIHGVPKRFMENIEEFTANFEDANNIKIKRITLLTKNARNPDAPTQSIVIFTESPEEANKCIDDIVIIERRLFSAERYNPQ